MFKEKLEDIVTESLISSVTGGKHSKTRATSISKPRGRRPSSKVLGKKPAVAVATIENKKASVNAVVVKGEKSKAHQIPSSIYHKFSDYEEAIDDENEDDAPANEFQYKRAKLSHPSSSASFMPVTHTSMTDKHANEINAANDPDSLDLEDDLPNFQYQSRFTNDLSLTSAETDDQLRDLENTLFGDVKGFAASDISTKPQDGRDASPFSNIQDYYSLSDTVSSIVSSPRDFDELLDHVDRETLEPYQPFESLSKFDSLDPLGSLDSFDTIINDGDEVFGSHFPLIPPFEKLESETKFGTKLSVQADDAETMLDSYYDDQLKFMSRENVETVIQNVIPQKAAQHTPKQQSLLNNTLRHHNAASNKTSQPQPKKQTKKQKAVVSTSAVSASSSTPNGNGGFKAALSSSINNIPVFALEDIIIQSSGNNFSSGSHATVTEKDTMNSNDADFSSLVNDNADLPSLTVGDDLSLSSDTSFDSILANAAASAASAGLNCNSDSESSTSSLWPPSSHRERSNSFATLVNKSSFKQLARALSKHPNLLDSLAASITSEAAANALEEEKITKSSKDDVSVEDFLNLIDESASAPTEEPLVDSPASSPVSAKIPLCGYRYRNQTMKIPTGALNAKKVLAALASISSANEKFVASFPSSPTSSSASASFSTDPAVASKSTSSSTKSIKAFSTNSTTTKSAGAPSSTSSKSEENPASLELTRSALEYYQQAVVAAAGLNRHSLYSGKAREMIAGSSDPSW